MILLPVDSPKHKHNPVLLVEDALLATECEDTSALIIVPTWIVQRRWYQAQHKRNERKNTSYQGYHLEDHACHFVLPITAENALKGRALMKSSFRVSMNF